MKRWRWRPTFRQRQRACFRSSPMSADIDPTRFGPDKIDALHGAGLWWDDDLDLWVNRENR